MSPEAQASRLRKTQRLTGSCGYDFIFSGQARHDLLEIVEERYGRRSTIVTGQPPVERWHDLIGDPTYADAILDRLVHNAHRIDLAGESVRNPAHC